MSKDYNIYLKDILESIRRIQEYSNPFNSANEIPQNEMAYDAIIRNLIVIGEAANSIPKTIQRKSEDIEWRKIVAFRNIVVHQYSEVDADIIWDIIQNKLEPLKASVEALIKKA